MRSMTAAFSALVLLGACAPERADPLVPVADQAGWSAPAAPTVEAQAACRARNGEMRRVGMLGSYQCIVRYADAGKRCTDGDQCQGDCRSERALPPPSQPDESAVARSKPPARSRTEGFCQADSNPFGCYAVVEDGEAEPMICID